MSLISLFNGLRISSKASFVKPLVSTNLVSFYSTKSHITKDNRKTTKPLFSRKTFLVDYYTHLNRTNEIVLYVHHNNLIKAENAKFRAELAKNDAKLTLIRNSLYNVFLKSEHEEDPADHVTSQRNKSVVHPISPLLNGPTAIITIPKCDPRVVEKILKTLKSANEKLILMGAKIEQNVFNIDEVSKFKDLPTKEELQAQLLGTLTVLSGSGLVQVLETPSKLLYLTGQELVKMNEPKEDDVEGKAE